MNLTKPNYLVKKEAAQKKLEDRNNWHKLVVKIISWSDGLVNGNTITKNNKITPKEWRDYVQGILRIHKDNDLSKIKDRLKGIRKLIESYSGFA